MPQDESSYPMLKIAEDIGTIKKGVENLEGVQNETNEKVSNLHQAISGLVKIDDCKDHRQELSSRIATQGIPELQTNLLERIGKKAGAIVAIMGLLGMLGTGLLVLSRFVARVEQSMQSDRKRQETLQRKVMKRLDSPVVVPMPAPVRYLHPDMGPPARRRARRRRRIP